jgi:hypothetical protein
MVMIDREQRVLLPWSGFCKSEIERMERRLLRLRIAFPRRRVLHLQSADILHVVL